MNKLRLMVSNIFFPVLLILVLVSWAYAKNGKDMSSIKALLNVRIIDGKTEQPLENGVLIIKDDLIVAVGNRAEITIPQSAQVINLKEMTIMPGLIDAHCHVCFYHLDPRSYTADEPDEILALRAAQNFKTLLETGVTTVRDTGGYKEITRSLKRALFMNLISGPNYFHSGRIITNSGGHGWKVSEIADGREEIIRSIRKRFPERANQCDFIKITWNRPGGYSHEEIKAAIETTHSYGKRIAIHAYQKETIRACVEYGADTIEHGWEIDSETIPLAVEKKTIIVPTLYWVWRPLFEEGFEVTMAKFYDKEYVRNYLETKKRHWKIIMDNLRPFVAAGGTIAMGTDSGGFPVDFTNAPDELMTYRELGLTPFQIIQAGTLNGAKAIGIENRTGTLEEGKWADIIVLDKNPLEDLKALKGVRMVIRKGEIVVDKTR